jgi:poly(3-hydroxybutyrate) depolymerase
VAYPAQAAQAHKGKCWKWYLPQDQARDRGEPSILAGIAREIASQHRIDSRGIFVAGMSAGAAMAVILGTTYPDLFAAVGAHSGLPYGAAHDLPSAFGVMKKGATSPSRPAQSVPTIVFHGERDKTVAAGNGAAIVEQVAGSRAGGPGLRADAGSGRAAEGRAYRRIVYSDVSGHPVVEHWIVQDAGHAWSGGCPSGSFTDPGGPDASAEMVRFFQAQPVGNPNKQFVPTNTCELTARTAQKTLRDMF